MPSRGQTSVWKLLHEIGFTYKKVNDKCYVSWSKRVEELDDHLQAKVEDTFWEQDGLHEQNLDEFMVGLDDIKNYILRLLSKGDLRLLQYRYYSLILSMITKIGSNFRK